MKIAVQQITVHLMVRQDVGVSSPNATHVEMLKIAGKDKVRTKYLKEPPRLKDVHIK